MGPRSPPAVVDEQGGMLATVRHHTPSDDPRKTEDVIADVVRELMASHDVEAVGVGAAGFVDAQRSTVLFAPNLAWRDEPLRPAIEHRCGLPVVIENDANAAAWAEARFGAGRGEDHVVILTIGTGLGGGIVHDGRLLRGRFGIAAEIGHINIVPHGRRCGCGLEGCWEQYASGRRAGAGGPGAREGRTRAGGRHAHARRWRAGDDHRPRGHRGRPRTATSRHSSASTSSARGSDAAWHNCRRSSTRACSCSGAAFRGRQTGPRAGLARIPPASHRPRAPPPRGVTHRRARP